MSAEGRIIKFEVEGDYAAIAWLDKMPGNVSVALQKAVRGLALDFEQNLKTDKLAGGMVNRRTGNLAASVRWQMRLNESQVMADMRAGGVGSQAPYASDVEYGTRPHMIQAINAKALRFEIGGKPIFRKRVNHPGTFPRPYMRSTLADMKPWIEIELEQAVRKAVTQ